MIVTVLVGNQGMVTGDFALVQPQLQVDRPAILESAGCQPWHRSAKRARSGCGSRPLVGWFDFFESMPFHL
ncbi:MAG: hypothetical protein CMM01_01335 [Rhodopirellula sp.]|nr:hypothetical protein [Rhodopirellula sp.]